MRLIVGCMTGTSLDGLDTVLCTVSGTGLRLRARVVARRTATLGKLATPLRALAEQQPMTAGAIAAIARDFALLHARTIARLCDGQRPDLVVVHGQTVYHAPPLSWQLFNPAVLAQTLAAPVISDLRAADLAAGGEGAPITPLADLLLYGHARERRTVINLGGFCNLTRLPAGRDPSAIGGGDVCACNQVLDAVARVVLKRPFDRDGRHALRGISHAATERALIRKLEGQRHARRSLGTGDELAAWISSRPLAANDLARTACAAVASVIAATAQPAERLVVAGGGVRNRALMAELTARSTAPVSTSDELGIAAGDREALAMAVLGALCQDGVAITLPQVTKVKRAPLAGTYTTAPFSI
jgi:1,6-anhydro-N-acetylmuramate kinase